MSQSSVSYYPHMKIFSTPVPYVEKSASEQEGPKDTLRSTAPVKDKQESDCHLCHKKCNSLAESEPSESS